MISLARAASLIALVAEAGALFLGQVMDKTPCVSWWYQRIAMLGTL